MARTQPLPSADVSALPPLFSIERGLIPSVLIAEAVDTLCAMLDAMGAVGGDLDARVDQVRALERSRLGAVYDAFRESLVFQRLVTAPSLVRAAKAAIGATHLHSPFQHAVFRMDLAGEHWRGFGWHQDTPYNMLSDRYVTAWFPLTASGAHNGGLQIAQAASDRIYPVAIRYKRDGQGNRLATRDAFIADEHQRVFDAQAETLSLEAGDVVLFHHRLVHRSGHNPGPRHRYSVQVRFGDMLAPDITARRWANRRADGFDTFRSVHPELVDSEETP